MDVINFQWKKIVKSEEVLLLTASKWNILFWSTDELSKIMSVAFHDSKTAKNIKLSEAKACFLTKFHFALNNCSKINKF